ncbi:hypothetical protein VTJ04DRAFT_6312 [Mycothermus thermophilus]|uniref:uncharacterized protein n=1 Tax=Humicola insolens TaxID=85995 RepID=UPI0037422276
MAGASETPMGIELTKLNERLVAIPPLQTSSLPHTMRRAIPNSSSGEGWQRKTVKQKKAESSRSILPPG